MEPVTAVAVRRIRAQSEEQAGDVVAREYPVTLVCRSEEVAGALRPAHPEDVAGRPRSALEEARTLGPTGAGGAGAGARGGGAPAGVIEVATLMCMPEHLDELALGFLYTGGLVSSPGDVRTVEVETGPDAARVSVTLAAAAAGRLEAWRASRRENWQMAGAVVTGCGYAALTGEGELPRVNGDLRVSVAEIMRGLGELVRAPVHRETGGTHAAALARGGGILCLREDVGRHNAVDKVAGWWLARGSAGVPAGGQPAGAATGGGSMALTGGSSGRVPRGSAHLGGPTEDIMVLTTGRLSSDIVLKVSRLGAQVLVSRAAPTSLGIRLAYLTGLTLVGFARPGRLNVYTFPERVVSTRD